jgi:hypothetical protein
MTPAPAPGTDPAGTDPAARLPGTDPPARLPGTA